MALESDKTACCLSSGGTWVKIAEYISDGSSARLEGILTGLGNVMADDDVSLYPTKTGVVLRCFPVTMTQSPYTQA